MPSIETITNYLNAKDGQAYLANLYGTHPSTLEIQVERYLGLLGRFLELYPERREVNFYSAPGRTEVGGNHTDHNAGRVLAAAVDLDIIAVASPNHEGVVRVHSEGFPPTLVKLSQLGMIQAERYTATSLVRGVCARFQLLGYQVGGIDAVVTSTVPRGSGLSSSAAYEVLMANILNHLYNQGALDPLSLAQIGHYAENAYFGKPCGLMDQTASAVGGFVTIDFKDFEHPLVRKVDFDFAASGYSLAIVDTAGDHTDLTAEYAAVEAEMKAVANALGGSVLREFSEGQVLEHIASLRKVAGDRAILRAIHFYRDDRRVVEQVAALEAGDFDSFLELVNDSGRSSWMLLQNCYPPNEVRRQGLTIALALSEALVKGRGAWRVHGGGFAGTIQAFVPDDLLPEYVKGMEAVFGRASCHAVHIRPAGTLSLISGT
jgi:galactokinase